MNPSINVEIKDINPMVVAFINVTGDFNQIPTTFQKLYGWINQKGKEKHAQGQGTHD